jgi:hypothetical protein
VIQDLGFQDKTGGGLVTGAIHLIGTANFSLINIQCRDITIGYCMQFDGGKTGTDENFTQFGTVVNPKVVNTLYPVQIVPQASEINFFGGDFNCAGLGSSIGMDLRAPAMSSLKAGGEFGVFGTHMINCVTGISMYNMANMNFYGILEQPSPPSPRFGDGIVIHGTLHADKSIIAGSIDGFDRGVVLQGAAQNTRLLANITATNKPLVVAATSLPSTLILTPQIYTGTGSTIIGDQMPDLTIPGEGVPDVPATGSRRLYLDSGTGNNSDLSVRRSDGTVVDLEGGLLNYQKATGSTIIGNGSDQAVYTFAIPAIPAGKGIRAKVYWQCTIACSTGNKTFSWQFGATKTSYAAYTNQPG